jgi:hypothetical protein
MDIDFDECRFLEEEIKPQGMSTNNRKLQFTLDEENVYTIQISKIGIFKGICVKLV